MTKDYAAITTLIANHITSVNRTALRKVLREAELTDLEVEMLVGVATLAGTALVFPACNAVRAEMNRLAAGKPSTPHVTKGKPAPRR